MGAATNRQCTLSLIFKIHSLFLMFQVQMLDQTDLTYGNIVSLPQLCSCFSIYLGISSFWPGTLWSLKSQGRGYRRVMGTWGPAVCASPGHAWSRRFFQIENRGSTRPTHPLRSALPGRNRKKTNEGRKHFKKKSFYVIWCGCFSFFLYKLVCHL